MLQHKAQSSCRGCPWLPLVNISHFDIVMESDEGTFMPAGLAFTGSDKARNIMKEIMKLLQPINATGVFEEGGGTDINYWIRDGIPDGILFKKRSYAQFGMVHTLLSCEDIAGQ
uniref:Uncharacterized protein n=1 Tax=Sphaerodactylus townsendi TaxID=933632 RepID=A0ACB8FE88_9SAUR